MIKPFAFVLMPFGKNFDDIYSLGIQETAIEKGVIAERVDEQLYTENILERIYRQIESADFIIADMTGKNPNVFYEVGYAHAKQKPCILITQKADDIPFDLKHHRHLIYDGSIKVLKDVLGKNIEWTKSKLELKKTTTFEIKAKTQNAWLRVDEFSRIGTFELVLDVYNRTDVRSPEIDAVYLNTSSRWEINQDEKKSGFTDSDHKTLGRKHILQTSTKRLGKGAWLQVKCELETAFWKKFFFEHDAPQEEYRVQGFLIVEISTSEGVFPTQIDLDVTFDEMPF